MTSNPIERMAVYTILDSLAAGPRAIAEMPPAWPVTRSVLRMIARRLVADGAVETVAGSRPLLQLAPQRR